MLDTITFGILGSGMLGRAIAQGLLRGGMPAAKLWLANRSGTPVPLEGGAGVTFTADPQIMARACDAVLLCLPPAAMAGLRIDLSDRLVLSVVAGLSLERMVAQTGAQRVIRAMSNPAAAQGLAYTPWIAGAGATAQDRALAAGLFDAIGAQDELTREAHIDDFTALTGPVPGFVACFAESMIRHAVSRGIPEPVATRAIRQLFHASGEMLAEGKTPATHVREMVEYGGTTAAGILRLRGSAFDAALSAALTAATERARSL